MPLYDCVCPTCKISREDMMIKHWDDKVECPKCGSDMKKLMSAVNFNIKGYNAANGYHR